MPATTKTWVSTALAATLLSTTALMPAWSAEVTQERLENPEPENWLMVHRDYSSTRFSPLDEINTETAGDLKVAFITAIGGLPGGGRWDSGGHQATPLVNDGEMYIVDGWGVVYKIDVSSGDRGLISWVMDPGVDKADVWIPSNRGVALYKDMVISVTGDGQVIWTKADTGEMVNSVRVDDPATGYSLTTPPLVIGNKLIVGGSGGDRGARSHTTALDADTGEELWRTYAIPAPGEPGHETWGGDNNAWEHGGGAFWVTGSYDPASNLTYWGTGQPVPMFDPEYRPGDNLYTNSTLAMDIDTGEIKWFFQYTPGDFMDYDEVGSRLLLDAEVGGEDRKLMAYFGRNGFFYTHDRTNGQFLGAEQYAQEVNWTDGIDPKTGLPVEYDPSLMLQTYKIGAPSRREQGPIIGCPHIQGGVNFFPTAYSPLSGLTYGAGIEGCSEVTADEARSDGEIAWNGGSHVDQGRLQGSLTAMNPTTQEQANQVMHDAPNYSGMLATAGGIVATGWLDGKFQVLDDETLEVLYEFDTGSPISSPPMTYAVDGKQYIALLVGANRIAHDRIKGAPELRDIQKASYLVVFSL
jgi:alcohol dehydrogenase (cytochrome c)